MTSATHIHPIEQPMAATDVASTAAAPASAERELEYRQLMRKWWYAAAIGLPTMILSYPG